MLKPGCLNMLNINGDNKIDANDRTYISATRNPDFTYGLNIGLTYELRKVLCLLLWLKGNDIMNNTLYFTDFPTSLRVVSVVKQCTHGHRRILRPPFRNSLLPVVSVPDASGNVTSYFISKAPISAASKCS